MSETLLILDKSKSYGQKIAGMVREKNVYCEVITKLDYIKENFKAIIVINSNDDNSFKDDVLASLDSLKSENQKLPPYLFVERDNLTSEELAEFLFDTCDFKGDWHIKDYIERSITDIKSVIGSEKAICALSGGVDSAVCAMLTHKAIGDRLTCIFVDHGLLRLNEAEEVLEVFQKQMGLNLVFVDARERFLDKLRGVTDPEQKRKIIGEEFIRVFEEEAQKLGNTNYLVQGTIYPDILESGSDSKNVVKSHHNVGGLPENVDFKGVVEPVKDLFKVEVRAIARELGLSEKISNRQPFPGPGLGIRVIGEITSEKLEILKKADYIFREELERSNVNANQYFAIITPIKSVGVVDGVRTYNYTLVLRAIKTIDFMTAQYVKIPYEVLDIAVERICKEVSHVGRIVYDVTNKPPSTIEWE